MRVVSFPILSCFGPRRGRRGVSRVDGVFTRQRRHDAVFMITREARRRRSHAGTLSRDEILTAVREDKRVLGFLRECKEAVLRDLLVPEKLEASLEEMDADKSGAVWKSTSASGAPDNSSLSQFSAMTRPSWLGRAVRNEHHHAIEQASRRWRGGRRDDAARTRHKILISTQVGRN